MNKSIIVALGSLAAAAIFSLLYFSFNKDRSAEIGWGILGLIYVGLQLFTGLMLNQTQTGKGLIIGSGLILLMGLSICTVRWV